MAYRYRVTITLKNPAWNEKGGIPYDVNANSKAEAIKLVRKRAEADGHVGSGSGSGLYWMRAELLGGAEMSGSAINDGGEYIAPDAPSERTERSRDLWDM